MSRKRGLKTLLHARREILRSLVEGEKTFYDFVHREKIGSNVTILTALKELVNSGLIAIGATGKRGRKPYTLTKRGLFVMLSDPELDFDRAVRGQADNLPLIFGKWDLIVKYDLVKYTIDALSEGIKYLNMFVIERIISKDIKTAEDEIRDIERYLNTMVWGPFIPYIEEEMQKFIPIEQIKHIIEEDRDIRSYFTSELEKAEKYFIKALLSTKLNHKLFL